MRSLTFENPVFNFLFNSLLLDITISTTVNKDTFDDYKKRDGDILIELLYDWLVHKPTFRAIKQM